MSRTRYALFHLFAVFVLCAMTLLGGCPKPVPGHGTAPKTRAASGEVRITMDPIQIVATREGERFRTEAFSAEDLFHSGFGAQRRKDCASAVRSYRRLLGFFPSSPYGAAAHYNLGLCLQHLGDNQAAGAHFEAAAKAVDKPSEQILALGAAGVNYADAGRWRDSLRAFDVLRNRKDLSTAQRIEAQTRYGFAWFKLRSFSQASEAFRNALRIYRENRTEERLPTLFYVAMSAYHLAAIYHEKFKETPLRMPVPQMQQDVEEMATWMYKAQRGYWDVVKHKNHFWSMAAVFQVGSLYAEFRDALLHAPQPQFHDVRYFDKTLGRYEMIRSAEQREEYYAQLRQKTRILLQHALTVYRKGLVTAERIGARNEWVDRMQREYDDTKRRFENDPDAGAPKRGSSDRRPPERDPLLPEALDPARYRPMAVEL